MIICRNSIFKRRSQSIYLKIVFHEIDIDNNVLMVALAGNLILLIQFHERVSDKVKKCGFTKLCWNARICNRSI